MRRIRAGSLATLLLLSPVSGWALDTETQAAKDESMVAYNLGFLLDAVPYLEVAAFTHGASSHHVNCRTASSTPRSSASPFMRP